MINNIRGKVIIFICIICPFIGQSQERVCRNLGELMSILENDFGYSFSYSSGLESSKLDRVISIPQSEEQLLSRFKHNGIELRLLDTKHLLLRTSAAKMDPYRKLTIKDSKSGMPISWASVQIPFTKEQLFSKDDGSVLLNSNVDFIKVSMLGYHDLVLSAEKIKQSNFNVLLNPLEVIIDEIEITDEEILQIVKNDFFTSFSKDPYYNRNVSQFGYDFIGLIQNLPGIDKASEENGKISIRGSGGDGTLILLDKMPIIQAGHFFNIFSSINPSYIQSYQLYKNTFPIAYGGKTGGVLEMQSWGQSDLFTFESDLNFLTASAVVSVPINQNWSLGVGFRTSISDISESNFYDLSRNRSSKNIINTIEGDNRSDQSVINSSPDFRFNDLNIGLKYKGRKSRGGVHLLSIQDKYDNNLELTQSILLRNGPKEINHNFDNVRTWETQGFGIDYQRQWNSGFSSSVNVYYTTYEDNYVFESSSESKFPNLENTFNVSRSQSSKVIQSGINWLNTFEASKDLTFKFGGQLQYFQNENRITNQFNETKIDPKRSIPTLYTSLEYKPNNRFISKIGIRSNQTQRSFDQDLEPSLFVKYWITKNSFIKSSWNRNVQYQREIEVRDLFDQSLSIWVVNQDGKHPVLSSNQFMVGLNGSFGKIQFDMEGYVKSLDGIAEFVVPSKVVNELSNALPRTLIGEGRNIGLDILTTYTSQNLLSQFSYTISKLTYQIDQLFQGNEYVAPTDRTHQINWSNTYKYKQFGFNFTSTFATGTPFFDAATTTGQPFKDLILSRGLTRLPDYIRHDIGLSYDIKSGEVGHTLSFGIYNLFNRENIKNIQYSTFIENVNKDRPPLILSSLSTMLSRTANLSWRVKF